MHGMIMNIMRRSIYSIVTESSQVKNILIVGAGGIGCQLTKILYKTPHKLTILDYDTISPSNLNRQFCFSPSNLTHPKAETLQKYFTSLNPNTKINIEVGNVFDYDQLFFQQFDVVITAVDNNQARFYCNLMAIDVGIGMIDAGTAGWNGQVQVFGRGVAECRGCRVQVGETISYAVCSLRGKPQRNIHCIQFALMLYDAIKNMHKNLRTSIDSISDSRVNQWQSLYKVFIKPISQHTTQQLQECCIKIHNILFSQSILNPTQPQITPITYPQPHPSSIFITTSKIPLKNPIQFLSDPQNEPHLLQKQWPIELYSFIFVECLRTMLEMEVIGDWDKDQFLGCLFVYCGVGLRIGNFRNRQHSMLKSISYYQCRDIAGKIIPAIASTNSIAAALQVLQLLHPSPSSTYLSIKSSHATKIQSFVPYKPKPGCPHCSPLYTCLQLYTDLSTTTWGQLQQYLITNFDDGFGERDMRCNEFVVIRNCGRKWHSNKGKVLDWNRALVRESRVGGRIVVVRYVGVGEFDSCWKVIVVDKKNMQDKITIKKAQDKKTIHQNIAKQIQKIKASKKLYQNIEQYKIGEVEVEQFQL